MSFRMASATDCAHRPGEVRVYVHDEEHSFLTASAGPC